MNKVTRMLPDVTSLSPFDRLYHHDDLAQNEDLILWYIQIG